jgi:hypothetical protein
MVDVPGMRPVSQAAGRAGISPPGSLVFIVGEKGTIHMRWRGLRETDCAADG